MDGPQAVLLTIARCLGRLLQMCSFSKLLLQTTFDKCLWRNRNMKTQNVWSNKKTTKEQKWFFTLFQQYANYGFGKLMHTS